MGSSRQRRVRGAYERKRVVGDRLAAVSMTAPRRKHVAGERGRHRPSPDEIRDRAFRLRKVLAPSSSLGQIPQAAERAASLDEMSGECRRESREADWNDSGINCLLRDACDDAGAL